MLAIHSIEVPSTGAVLVYSMLSDEAKHEK